MKLRFLSVAAQEYKDAYDYYEDLVAGLGDEFRDEFIRCLKRMESFPSAWQVLSKNTRRCRLDRFPYGVVYHVLGDNELLIVAVMHLKRAPKYWIKRKGTQDPSRG